MARLEGVTRSNVVLFLVVAVVLAVVVVATVKYGMGEFFLFGAAGVIAVHAVGYCAGYVVSRMTPADRKTAVQHSTVVVWKLALVGLTLWLLVDFAIRK